MDERAYIWNITGAKYVSIIFVIYIIGYTEGHFVSIFDHAVHLLPDDFIVNLARLNR